MSTTTPQCIGSSRDRWNRVWEIWSYNDHYEVIEAQTEQTHYSSSDLPSAWVRLMELQNQRPRMS